MRLRDLQSFKQFLGEDEGEDIVSGLRKLVTDIRTNWKSPYSATKAEQEKLWKKLSPSQQAALRQQFDAVMHAAMGTVSQPIKTTGFNPASKIEASVIVMTFRRLAKDLQDQIGPNFLEMASTGPVPLITPEKAEELRVQYNSGGFPMDKPLGRTTLEFVRDHLQQLTRLVVIEDEGAFGLDIYNVPRNLVKALQKTPKDKVEEAVHGVHYLLLRMARQFSEASMQLEKQYAGKSLPTEAPQDKPDGGIKPKM